jgi:hypothetical protein
MAIRRKRQLVDRRRGGNRTEKFRNLQKLLPGGGGAAPIAAHPANGANRRPTVPDTAGGADESDKAVAASARSVETEALKSVS